MGNFHLKKWYVDVASEREAFIGYAATLRWKWVNLVYNGFTLLTVKGIKKRNSFSDKNLPTLADDTMRWNGVGVNGYWRIIDQPFEEVLLENSDGKLTWTCLQPKTDATVEISGNKISGLGYTECLELTMPPWKLPIHELHWGRFLSQTETIVWIRWIGPHPKELLYRNGTRVDNPQITKDKIVFEDHILILSESIPMRTGTVFSNVFSRFPALAKIFPKSILQLQENKWLSTGILSRNNAPVAIGKAIHEVVLWK